MATRTRQRLRKLEEQKAPATPNGPHIYDPKKPPDFEAEPGRIDGPLTVWLPDNGRGDGPLPMKSSAEGDA